MTNQGASTSSESTMPVLMTGSFPLEANVILQLKVSLTGCFKPPIWRHLLVPNKFTFIQLHDCIRDCMGWSDYHLHQFTFGTRRSPTTVIIGKREKYWDEFDPEEFADEMTTTLYQYLSAPKDTVEYTYDLGGSWHHKVAVEKVLPFVDGKYPKCLAGREFPPPEEDPPYHSDDEDYEEPEPAAPKKCDPKLIAFNVRPSLMNLVAA